MDLIGRASNMGILQKHIPQLRFPDFLNDGEWEVKRLGEIAKVVDEKCNIGKLNIETYISTENMLQNLEGVKKATKLPDTGSFTRFQKGDILFSNIRPYLKKVWQAEFDGAASNDVIVFRALSGFDFHFVSQIIKSDSFIAHTMAGAKGVKMPRGDKNMMMDYLVCIPSLAEQRRIAACLSALDEMLSATNGKLERLKTYKKGLMQKLFPAKGKKLPELRFKEFEKDGVWEEKKLATIVHQITTGKLDANAMVSNGEYRFYTCAKDYAFINEYAFDTEALLISGNGAHLGYIHYYKGKFNAYQRTYVLSDFQCDIFYLKYYLESFLPDRINKEKKEGNTPYIVLSTLTEMDISLPSNFEQHKIADCLTSIDEMINQYTNKVTFLELYKKGLMQQLFPTSK